MTCVDIIAHCLQQRGRIVTCRHGKGHFQSCGMCRRFAASDLHVKSSGVGECYDVDSLVPFKDWRRYVLLTAIRFVASSDYSILPVREAAQRCGDLRDLRTAGLTHAY